MHISSAINKIRTSVSIHSKLNEIIMAALELLCHLVGINPAKLLKEESILLEAELFLRFCDELKEIFRTEYKNYFHVMRFTIEKENTMLDNMFVRLVLIDILSTNEYSVNGIAHYIDVPEDVIHEVIDGRNTNPSAQLLRRTIALHRTVRRDLYRTITKKITSEHLLGAEN